MSQEFPDLNKKPEPTAPLEELDIAEPKELHPIEQLRRRLLEETPQLALDEEWFSDYVAIERGLPPTLESLAGNPTRNKAERAAFTQGEIQNPTFTYENINQTQYDWASVALLDLQQRVKRDMEQGDDEKKEAGAFYLAHINKQFATYRMLKLIGEQRGQEEDPEVTKRRSRKIQKYADFLQPRPSRKIFKFFLDAMREDASKTDATGNPHLEKARDDLLAVLPEFSEESASLIIDPEKQRQVEELAQRELPEVYGISLDFDPNKVDGPQQVFNRFDSTLKHLSNGIKKDWKTVWKAGNTAGVDASFEELRVGRNMSLQGQTIQENLLHEMTHVERSVLSHKKLKLLSIGLPGYKDSEEGITTLKELAVYGRTKDFGGYHSYIGTALGRGIAKSGFEGAPLGKKEFDIPPRDFRGVYDFYEKFFLFEQLKKHPNTDIESAKKGAADAAWNRACRIFRGSNGQTVGYSFNSETTYGNGTFKMWGIFNRSTNVTKTYKAIHSGKWDISIPGHRKGLRRMNIILEEEQGISDEELDALNQE